MNTTKVQFHFEKVPQIQSAKYDTAMTTSTWVLLHSFITTISYKNYFTYSRTNSIKYKFDVSFNSPRRTKMTY
jgi:hypothetical protein